MELSFMNLSRQVERHKKEFMDSIEKVVDDTAFSGGLYARLFEEEFAKYIGSKYCSGLSSGTSAVFMAMKALGVSSGDEVIVPANTFIASAWGALYCGAKPVFVDCDKDTWEIDAQSVASAITPMTKAIVGVHLYGLPFDIDEIKKISGGIPIVEDCAQAHGAKYKNQMVGKLGSIGCFSFYPGKNLGAFGEAGAITTDDKRIYELVEVMKCHGSALQYHHDIEGYNLRLDGIQAAVLSTKLRYLDEWNSRRKDIAKSYNLYIDNERIKKQLIPQCVEPVHHLFEIEVDDVDKFFIYMSNQGINCGRHYPVSCHLQKVFGYLGYKEGDVPNAEYHAKHCVSLPMFPEMTDDEVQFVVQKCNEYV